MSTDNGVVQETSRSGIVQRTSGASSSTVQTEPTDRNPGAAKGSRLECDLVVRERTASSDPVAKKIAYSHPITGGANLDEMQLASFLDEVEARDPLLAKHLRSVQQDRIRPQFQRLQDVRVEADTYLDELRSRSIELDGKTDEIVARISAERDLALEPHEAKLNDAIDELSRAHISTADLLAKASLAYDPQEPAGEIVIKVLPLSEADAADTLKMPFGDGITTTALLPKWLSWICTAVCGCVFGLSLGLASGLLHSQDIVAQPNLKSIVVFAIIGTCLVSIGRGWLRLAWYQFSESYWLGLSRIRQLAWFSSAAASTIIVTGAVMTTDRQGILRAAIVESAWSQNGVATSEFVFWTIAVATSFCLGYAVFEGLALGRQDPIENAIAALIDRDHRSQSDARRAEPAVLAALPAHNRARTSQLKQESALKRVNDVRLPFDNLIAKAEQERLPYPLEHTETMKRRVQDALHNLEGLQIEFDALVSDYLVHQADRDRSEHQRLMKGRRHRK